jgi:hypothetical protein
VVVVPPLQGGAPGIDEELPTDCTISRFHRSFVLLTSTAPTVIR